MNCMTHLMMKWGAFRRNLPMGFIFLFKIQLQLILRIVIAEFDCKVEKTTATDAENYENYEI